MAGFNILDYLVALEPDGGSNDPKGDHSFKCPACGANNFKVNIKTGKWGAYSCDCAASERGKRRIRQALSPAENPNSTSVAKPRRPKQERHWDYFTAVSLEQGQPAITVNRWDDPDHPNGNGWKNGRKINQTFSFATRDQRQLVTSQVQPYRLHEAIKALADDAPYVFWPEGEPCCDVLWDLGLPAITNIGGSGQFDPERDGPDATGIPSDRLVVVPDRDKPGIKHAESVAAAYPGCHWLYPFPDTAQWKGSCPPNGGLDIADWIAQGATVEDILNGIGDRRKPKELNDIRDEFLLDAQSLKARLDRGLEQIDNIPDVATRSVALHTLKKSLELGDKTFEALVRALSEAKAPKAAESFDTLMSEGDEDLTALVDDLFPSGLILIAAEGFAGKSNTAYQIAEAVTNGTKFAGQFQCQKSAALIVQMDESKVDAKRKFKVLGLKPAPNALTIKWHFSPMMFPELRRWVTETGSKLVILDSLMTIAGGTISPKDAEFGLLIYRLNQLAAELGLTIICLHHVIKAGGKQRTEIIKDDIFGTAYVYNGSSEAWGLWQSREDGNPEPVFNLRCLKTRSGLVDQSTTYQFEGNDEDKRLTYRGMAGRTVTLDQIKNARGRVAALLRSASGTALSPKTVNERLQLGNVVYARRLCRELYETPSIAVGRKLGSPNGGRPAYLYFWDGDDSRVRNTCVVSIETPLGKDTFQHLGQTFDTERDLRETEESEGERGEFRADFLPTREEPQPPRLFVDRSDLPF